MYVAYWHLADNPTAPAFVPYWGKADIGPDQRLTPVGCHFSLAVRLQSARL